MPLFMHRRVSVRDLPVLGLVLTETLELVHSR